MCRGPHDKLQVEHIEQKPSNDGLNGAVDDARANIQKQWLWKSVSHRLEKYGVGKLPQFVVVVVVVTVTQFNTLESLISGAVIHY